ncbi:uncharacterized protein LOC134024680 [Osmerus eperlanus]|uniref:uncharacterized protein LOC134024680 n=1 Tax=Osmerus eperlanus TaxID=29151 RepID=UPI002E13BC28
MKGTVSLLALLLCLSETWVQGESKGVVRDSDGGDIGKGEVQLERRSIEEAIDRSTSNLVTTVPPDIWAELLQLRDMVVEQRVELRILDSGLKETESQVDKHKIELVLTRNDVEELEMTNAVLDSRLKSSENQVAKLTRQNADQVLDLFNMKAELQLHQNKLAHLERENADQALELLDLRYGLETSEGDIQFHNNSINNLKKENGVQDNELHGLTVNQNTMKSQLEELQRDNTKVAFHAALTNSGDVGPYSEDRILKFSKVLTNVGNRYSPVTGYFEAPVRGVYYVRFTVCGPNFKDNMGVKLHKDDVVILWN